MKIMASHGSAKVRSKKLHVNAVLKQRAESLINNKSIDGTTRNVLRYALEIDDPLLDELVGRVDAGESIIDEQGSPANCIVKTVGKPQRCRSDRLGTWRCLAPGRQPGSCRG